MDPLSGMPEDQSFEVRCEHPGCMVIGRRWRGSCSSGRVREKALQFAAHHVHRDPFASTSKP